MQSQEEDSPASVAPPALADQSLLVGCLNAPGDNVIEQMLSGMLRDAHGVACHAMSRHAGVAVARNADTPASVHHHDGICAAIIGTPRWADSQLAKQAQEAGHASALLAAYREHGRDLLRQLHGPFAISISDGPNQKALLAIDRIGIHTMAWTHQQERLLFGNAVRSVAAHPSIEPQIDPQAIFDFCFFHVVPAPGSIYKGIHKLEAGQLLELRNGQVRVERYWEPEFAPAGAPFDPQLEEELHECLKEAVSRCQPDADTAAFLSGGLDSSTVCGVANAQTDGPLNAYAMGFEADGYDEMHYARTAAGHFGLQLHERYVNPVEIAETLPVVAAWYDEPFGNSSAVPAYLCARTAAGNGVRQLLAGDGGDELFAGNERYVKQALFAHYDGLPGWLQKGLLEPVSQSAVFRHLPMLKKVSSYVSQARIGMPGRLESYNFLMRTPHQDVFQKDFLAQIDPTHPIANMKRVYDRAPSEVMLDKMLYLDWQLTLADNDLRKVGGMCAAAGVQVRYPLLDEDLLALSLRVPAEEKIRNRRLRNFFKNSLSDFLPREIIEKPKHGFGLPFGVWLKSTPVLQDVVYSSLHALKRRDLLNPEFIDNLIDTHKVGHASYYGYMLWVLVILENWLANQAA